MGYPQFGKVKTVVLPLSEEVGETLSIKEYKERYGIDLTDFFRLNNDQKLIELKPNPNTLFLVQTDYGHNLYPASVISANKWVEGLTNADITFGFITNEYSYGGIILKIRKDVAFSIENITVEGYAY